MTAALVDRLRALPAADRARILAGLTWREKAMLAHLWSFWLRPDDREPGAVCGTGQMPPASNWIFWVLQGGRAAGKSLGIGSWFTDEAQRLGAGFVGAIVCSTVDEARKLIDDKKTGFVHHTAPPWHGVEFEPSVFDGLLTWKSGARAYVFSADKPAKARAGNFNRVWIDDPPKFGPGGKRFLDTFLKAIRVEGHGLRIGIATTPPDPNDPPSCPELLEWILDQQHAPQPDGTWVFSYAGSSDDNLQNLDPDFRRMLKQFEGRENEEAERAGIYVKDGGTRIFAGVDFDACRALVLPDMFDEITISIDPADSSNTKACEVGIVVGGVRLDLASGFLVEDASGHFSSDQWPARAWDAAERWAPRARRWHFLIEDNRGTVGVSLLRAEERIRQLMRNPGTVATPRAEIRTVTSRQAKGDRARPLPGIYRAGQAKHARGLEQVEAQMRRLTEAERQQIRLDRADAGVYALLDLFGHLAGQAATALGAMPDLQVGAMGGRAQQSITIGGPREDVSLTMAAPAAAPYVGAFGRREW